MIAYVPQMPEELKEHVTLHGDKQDYMVCKDRNGIYAYACGDCYSGTGTVQLHCVVIRNAASTIRGLRKDVKLYTATKAKLGYTRFFAMKQGVDIKWGKFVMAIGFPAPEVFMGCSIEMGDKDA